MCASSRGRIDIVRFLLEKTAELNVQNHVGLNQNTLISIFCSILKEIISFLGSF